MYLFFFFFFQAEDGIRDHCVTGVQTCALPIWLDGKDNECGGVYTKAAPKVNMCLPPLTWQTYDAEFTNAVREGDKVVRKARLTLRHNGVVIHDNLEIAGPTGGHRMEPEGTPGPITLQGHGNPL